MLLDYVLSGCEVDTCFEVDTAQYWLWERGLAVTVPGLACCQLLTLTDFPLGDVWYMNQG